MDRYWTGRQIAAVVGGMPHESLVEDVYRSSHGNPYLTKLLVTGLDPMARSLPTDLPTNLGDAVLASWHGLSPGSRGLATVLAVAGRPMSRSDITELVAGRLDTSRVPEQLWEARDHALLDIDREGRYWFHHPLQAEVLEAQLHPEDRREWHEVCAKLLESRLETDGHAAPDGARLVAIADHYSAAGLTSEAYSWSLRVAGLAGAVSLSDVARALERALELRAVVDNAVETRADLLWRLRRVAADSGDLECELQTVEDLLVEVDRDAEPADVAELLVRHSVLRVRTARDRYRVDDADEAVQYAERAPGTWQHAVALAHLSTSLGWVTGRSPNARATACADVAVAIAERAHSHLALARALAARAMAACSDGDLARAGDVARRAHDEAVLSRDWDTYVLAASQGFNALGDPRSVAARDLWEERRQQLMDLGGPHSWAAAMSQDVAEVAIHLGDVPTAREMIRFALGANPGRTADVSARMLAARLATLTGSLEEARQHIARAHEIAAGFSAHPKYPSGVLEAELDLALGNPRAAFEACDQLQRRGLTMTMGEWLLPLAARALADLRERARADGSVGRQVVDQVLDLEWRFPPGPSDESGPFAIMLDGSLSNPHYRSQVVALDAWYAAELARAKRSPDGADVWEGAAISLDESGLPWEAAYAWMRLGEAHLLGERPDRRAAAAALRGAVERATPLGAHPVLEKVAASARTARIDVSLVGRPPENGHLPGLTRREREILEHLVAGRTYSEIAEALYVSEKTVSSHISNMLRKTGTSNRHELAARALASRR